jgi:hypothetical protein
MITDGHDNPDGREAPGLAGLAGSGATAGPAGATSPPGRATIPPPSCNEPAGEVAS